LYGVRAGQTFYVHTRGVLLVVSIYVVRAVRLAEHNSASPGTFRLDRDVAVAAVTYNSKKGGVISAVVVLYLLCDSI